jgi:hypothetical protein
MNAHDISDNQAIRRTLTIQKDGKEPEYCDIQIVPGLWDDGYGKCVAHCPALFKWPATITGEDSLQALHLCLSFIDKEFASLAHHTGLQVWWIKKGDNGQMLPQLADGR